MNDQPYLQKPQRQDGLPVPQRYWSAAAIWLALTMAVLDGTIMNVAVPIIGRELGASPATSVWVINAYQLTITILLLPFAALGDRIGYRRIYIPALVLFTLGSLGSALSRTLFALIGARIFQGVGAAGIMSMNAALVRLTWPSNRLGRGMGYNAMILSASAAAGPTLAALILSVAHWPWLFLINIPLGVAAVIIGMRCLPAARGQSESFDWVSALLSALMMGLAVYGADEYARTQSPVILAVIAAGIISGALLVWREWKEPAPLIPLDLIKIPIFSISIATSIVSFAAQMLAYVTLPFLFESVLGRSVLETGFLMTPWPLALGVIAPFAGRLADRYPAGLLGGVGLGVMAIGLFFLSGLGNHPATLDIAWRMAVCGAGFGFFQSPNNRTIIVSAPRHRSGAAGGMLATARLLGQTSGAVTVAAAFHLFGVTVGSKLLFAAAIAATIAALISLTRLRTGTRRFWNSAGPIVG